MPVGVDSHIERLRIGTELMPLQPTPLVFFGLQYLRIALIVDNSLLFRERRTVINVEESK